MTDDRRATSDDFVPAEPSSAAEAFYSGALPRIRRFMLVIGPAAALGVWAGVGWRFGLGFICGCAIAYLNFYWLKTGVFALADRVTRTGKRVSGAGIAARFLLRYLLIALVAYAIFKVSVVSLYGLLAGLFLPVAAILCEAVYEAYGALRKGL